MDTNNGRCGLIFWISGVVLWALAAWWFIFPPPSAVVEEYFSRHWYRWMLSWLTPVTQLFGFPVIEILIAAALVGFAVLWLRTWIRIRGWAGALWGFRVSFLVVPVLIVWFLAFWGAGYRRVPVVKRLGLDSSAVTDAEAAKIRILLLRNVKRDLTSPGDRNVDRAVASIAAAMSRTVKEWDGRPIALPARVKGSVKGLLLSNGSTGVCSPFTLEAVVDGGLPDTAYVYTAAHELGHVAGFCAEDEATFVGYVAGLEADDRFARYACALAAYADFIRQLGGTELRSAVSALPELARRDLAEADEAYGKYRIEFFSRIGWHVYDRYLRAQGIDEGVRNYSRGILLLSYGWRKGLLPRLENRRD